MTDVSGWKRVPCHEPIAVPLDDETDSQFMDRYLCAAAEYWARREIPVVMWDSEHMGVGLLPQKTYQ